jgi:crotonobetainyl-CoA:carnitine CoA-transferase CaiB-like acyl-CoA transferase
MSLSERPVRIFAQHYVDKKGLCVILKDPCSLELLHKLVAKADVFVET